VGLFFIGQKVDPGSVHNANLFSFSIEFVNKIFTKHTLFLVIFYFIKMTKGFSFVKNVWLWIAIAVVLVI
jgi:hypothetical protein